MKTFTYAYLSIVLERIGSNEKPHDIPADVQALAEVECNSFLKDMDGLLNGQPVGHIVKLFHDMRERNAMLFRGGDMALGERLYAIAHNYKPRTYLLKNEKPA